MGGIALPLRVHLGPVIDLEHARLVNARARPATPTGKHTADLRDSEQPVAAEGAVAGDLALGLLLTGVKAAGAAGSEGAVRRRGPADVVEAPAEGGAVALDVAGVVEPGADRDYGGGRRSRLPVGVGAPAAHGAGDPD